MEATIAMKLKQLQAMTAHDALVHPEFQQRDERHKLEQEILNTFDQTRELLDAIQVICDDPQTSYHIPGVLMDRLIALQAAMEVTS